MGKIEKLILMILLVAYTSIGLIHSHSQGFWHDEVYSLTFLKGLSTYDFEGSTIDLLGKGGMQVADFKERFQSDRFLLEFPTQIVHEGHPPLYFLFLKMWSLIFGVSELSLRSFSLLCGVLSIAVLFQILRVNLKSQYIRWTVVLFALTNPFLFYFFTEARMYAFAFLIAMGAFYYWLKLLNSNNSNYRWHFIFLSTALLYTHYYGLFFLTTLLFLEVLLKKDYRRSIFHLIPFALFVPWGIVIKKQTELHNIHWTDGSFPLWESLYEFGYGLVSLLFSPLSHPNIIETIIAGIIITVILYFFGKNWQSKIVSLLVILIYFLQIFVFDQLQDHHTVAVPRYYIFLLIFLFFIMAKAFDSLPKRIGIIVTLSYCIIGSINIFQIYNLTKAPKQMYKEVAGYIDSQYQPEDVLIIVEPHGAMTSGLAYYLNQNFELYPATETVVDDKNRRFIYVDEMLGVPFREGLLHKTEQKPLKLIPFVGVFLYE